MVLLICGWGIWKQKCNKHTTMNTKIIFHKLTYCFSHIMVANQELFLMIC